MTIEKRTFSLPSQHNAFIDKMIDSGHFASASEVVRAGLRALQERDEAVENWLKTEVAPAYDLLQKNPDSGIPMDDVFDKIRAKHNENLKDKP